MRHSPNYVDQINSFLANNGASLFGTDVWVSLIRITQNNIGRIPTMIIAPSDKAIAKLVEISNRTWPEISLSTEGQDILKNHISVMKTQKEWPMFTAINGKHYGRDQEDFNILSPLVSTIIQPSNTAIIIVDNFILHGDQLAQLKRSRLRYSVWQRPNLASIHISPQTSPNLLRGDEIPKLGKDVFKLMVMDQKIAGRDLLALCTGSSEIATLCDRDDQLLFRQLLKREFNFDYDKLVVEESARELYAKFHDYRLEVYVRYSPNSKLTLTFFNYSVIDSGQNIPSQEEGQAIKTKSELIAVPLEQPFADTVKGFDATNSLYVIFVRGKSESATLLYPVYSKRGVGAPPKIHTSNDWFEQYFACQEFTALGRGQEFRSTNPNDLIAELVGGHFRRYTLQLKTNDGNLHYVTILRLEEHRLY
jgi:hypothetical protein